MGYAKNLFESLVGRNGKHIIENKLKQKGVSKEIIDELLEGLEEDVEFDGALTVAEKFAKNRQKDAKNKQKCIAHLIYKGYDYGTKSHESNFYR